MTSTDSTSHLSLPSPSLLFFPSTHSLSCLPPSTSLTPSLPSFSLLPFLLPPSLPLPLSLPYPSPSSFPSPPFLCPFSPCPQDAKAGLTMSVIQDKIIEIATLLVARRGKLSAKDDDGMTPEAVARKFNFSDLAQIMADLQGT